MSNNQLPTKDIKANNEKINNETTLYKYSFADFSTTGTFSVKAVRTLNAEKNIKVENENGGYSIIHERQLGTVLPFNYIYLSEKEDSKALTIYRAHLDKLIQSANDSHRKYIRSLVLQTNKVDSMVASITVNYVVNVENVGGR